MVRAYITDMLFEPIMFTALWRWEVPSRHRHASATRMFKGAQVQKDAHSAPATGSGSVFESASAFAASMCMLFFLRSAIFPMARIFVLTPWCQPVKSRISASECGDAINRTPTRTLV